MSRVAKARVVTSDRFPRVSGDEPWGREKAKAEALFSPRERG